MPEIRIRFLSDSMQTARQAAAATSHAIIGTNITLMLLHKIINKILLPGVMSKITFNPKVVIPKE